MSFLVSESSEFFLKFREKKKENAWLVNSRFAIFCSPWRRVKGFERIFSISFFLSLSFVYFAIIHGRCQLFLSHNDAKRVRVKFIEISSSAVQRNLHGFSRWLHERNVYDFHHQMHEISIYSSGKICLIPRSHSSSPLLCLSNVIYHFHSSHRQSSSSHSHNNPFFLSRISSLRTKFSRYSSSISSLISCHLRSGQQQRLEREKSEASRMSINFTNVHMKISIPHKFSPEPNQHGTVPAAWQSRWSEGQLD